MSTEWFRRLADVPGVGYAGSPGVDRLTLKGHDAVPTVSTLPSDFSIERLAGRQSLMWGSGSASPAHERAFAEVKTLVTPQLLRNLAEALELPGQPKDYHFAIQGAVTALWSRRRSEPNILEGLERLCWLDIRLIEARPGDFSNEGILYSITAMNTLVTMYEREGALLEALEVAELAERLGQLAEKAAELRDRHAVVQAENAG